jgi:amino acid adenylation domain-containing protein
MNHLRPLDLSDTRSSILTRLDEIARSRPQASAARFADVDLTWSELDQRSNALALRLHADLGPGPEPVAIVSTAGPDMIIAPIAVLKSGRPYTSIDTSLPLARVMQILSLSEARGAVVGTGNSDLNEAMALIEMPLHRVDLSTAPNRPLVSTDATDPANIVFTSGSTGTPKGVVAPHHYHLLHAATCAERGFGSDDRVGLVIPMSFALGAIVFWRTMLLGATILPYDPREHGITALASWCAEQRIEVLEATPSFFRSLARGTTEVIDSLRIVESAGEPLFARDVTELRRCLQPACTFRNSIGSSETGAYGFFEIPQQGPAFGGIVPVGIGTPHKEVAICDPEGAEVPLGSTGRIFVTSAFLAGGYWRQPELTAQKFVETPDGRTRYDTGDLGRWLHDGSLLHVGRSDGMVKIRGYLVEPTEVEAALLDTGLVSEAAVFGVVDEERTSLHAYVVPIDGVRTSNASIRRALRERVPEYYVPTALVAVRELPKNDNNKIDRGLLSSTEKREVDSTPPRDDWERAVAAIWCTILGLDRVGLEDDFFSLGGDSLGVLELVAAMSEDHGVTVRSVDLVECPTLGEFAARAREPAGGRGRVLVPLKSKGVGPPLFLFSGGGILALKFVPLACHLNLGRPIYGFQARGLEGGGIPDWSARRWAARCVRQIRQLQPHGPYYLGGHSFGAMLAMEAARQLTDVGEEIALLVLIDPLKASSVEMTTQASGRGGGTVPPSSGNLSWLSWLRSLGFALRVLRTLGRVNVAGIWPELVRDKWEQFYFQAVLLNRIHRPSAVDCPTVVYWAAQADPSDIRHDLDRLLGGPWEQHTLAGDHLTILHEPNVESLAEHLRRRVQHPSMVGMAFEGPMKSAPALRLGPPQEEESLSNAISG